MRLKKYIQRFYNQAVSNLIVHRQRGHAWSEGTTQYLLGQAVALKVVLEAEITWSDANEVITTQVERALENPPKGDTEAYAAAPDQPKPE